MRNDSVVPTQSGRKTKWFTLSKANGSNLVLVILLASVMMLGFGGTCQNWGGSNATMSGSSAPLSSPSLPPQVTAHNPADTATNVITTTQLSWAAASNATSYNLYFGTDNPPSNIINGITASTPYNPGTLNPITKYYWRIDSVNSAGTTTGVVWSFTTASSGASINLWTQKIANGAIGSPSVRDSHSMVWDNIGQRVIMFGGYASTPLNDLWWYYPATNTWIPQFTSITPPARYGHSMVWDNIGQRVIMFGGYACTSLNDLWWYYPATNTWIPQVTSITPSARHDHLMVWDGQKLILFGGFGLNDLWWYYPGTNTWIQQNPSGGPASVTGGQSMVWDNIGQRVIMFGGYAFFIPLRPLNDLWWYYPATNTWIPQSTSITPPARYNHSMVWDGQKVILFDGDVTAWNSGPSPLADLWWYYPGTNTWIQQNPSGGPPTARGCHSMVWDGQKVILFGGDDSNYNSLNYLWWLQ
jgi:hypothetical protein